MLHSSPKKFISDLQRIISACEHPSKEEREAANKELVASADAGLFWNVYGRFLKEELLNLSKSDFLSARSSAIFALARCGACQEVTALRIAEMLDSPEYAKDPCLRYTCFEAMQHLGFDALPLAPKLLR